MNRGPGIRRALLTSALALQWGSVVACSNATTEGSAAGASGEPGAAGSSNAGTAAEGGTSAAAGQSGGVAAQAGAEDGGVGGGVAPSGVCGAQRGQLFDATHPWNQRVDTAQVDAESDAIVAYLQQNHTAGARFRIDGPSDEAGNLYGITVLNASAGVPKEVFEPTEDFYTPDCDSTPVPVPVGGAIEGEAGYACESDGDCHLLVVDTAECRLYEMWRANRAETFQGGCLAVWDLTQSYVPELRGDCCTSADAAGLPIAAHMFSADEVAAGEIPHALRFILPNALIRERIYVRPATHSTGATSGPADAPPYGVRMRLRADADLSGLNPAARVVGTALQRYGMVLSDGGNLTFTALNDRFTTAKWADVGLGPGDLTSLEWSDFEVVDGGPRLTWDDSCSCSRTPLAE